MDMRNEVITLAVAALLGLPAGASAGTADQQAPRPAGANASVVVEPIENTFVLAPEVKMTRVNDRDVTLVGGYGGLLLDKSLLIGGAGYWLANDDRHLKMAYGGGLLEWYLFSRRAVDVSIRGLAGAGRARVAHSWGGRPVDNAVTFGHHGTRVWADGTGAAGTTPAYLVYETGFLIGEPQLNVVWHIGRRVALVAGVSYRAIATEARGLDKDLRGAAGSVSIRFGGGK
jgi:hypothetical protein